MSESNLQCTWLNDKFVNSTRRIGTHVLNYNLHPRILTWDHAEILVDYMNGEKNDGTDCKVAYMDHQKKKSMGYMRGLKVNWQSYDISERCFKSKGYVILHGIEK